MRRRPFLLLELLIALTLAAVLLVYLFESQADLLRLRLKIDRVREEVLPKTRFYLRMRPLFSRFESCSLQNNQLTLHHRDNLDPNPSFCGQLASTLYLDHGNLVLATYPQKGDPRLEIVYENVESISYAFWMKSNWKEAPSKENPHPKKVKIFIKKEGKISEYPYWIDP